MAIKTKPKTKWFPILKTGVFTDAHGRTREWTQGDLEKIVEMNSGRNDVPAVLGHPKTNDPAYGWLDSLKVASVAGVPHLFARLKDVVLEFAGLVDAGMFKYVSSSIWPADMRLRHIGFLGAAAPAVEGMAPVEFAAGDDDERRDVVFEYALNEGRAKSVLGDIVSVLSRVRDWITSENGIEEAEKIVPSGTLRWMYADVENLISTETVEGAPASSYSQSQGGVMDPELKALKEQVAELAAKLSAKDQEIATLTTQNGALSQQLNDSAMAAAMAEYSAFVDQQVADGRLLPAHRDVAGGLMGALQPAQELEFSEGVKKHPLVAFKEFLAGLPKGVAPAGGEVATDHSAAAPGDNGSAQDIAGRALAYQREQAAKGISVTVSAAVDHVSKING